MSATKKRACFRFYGALNEVLPVALRQSEVRYDFWGRPSVKDAIEAQGVPHPEIDLVIKNDTPVSFDATLGSGDQVSVYPWFQQLDRPDDALRPPWPSPLRFVCDVHLGRLARCLRMLGLDTRYDPDRGDRSLARLSDEEDRILLTRDVGLRKRSRVRLGAFVRGERPKRQFAEVVECFGLGEDDLDPFDRCLDCNVPTEPADPTVVVEEVPPHARRVNDAFWQCPSCETVYWVGTHVERMRRLIRKGLGKSGS